jgi:HlyD family secretion protein
MNARLCAILLVVGALLLAISACRRGPSSEYQGYVVGDYVMVASPVSGQLLRLDVRRGARVEAGAGLFALEPQPELDAFEEAGRNLVAAQAALADIQKGERPARIATLEHARLAVEAAQRYADIQLTRSERLYRTKVVSQENLNLYQSADLVFQEAVAAIASLTTEARLGGREDQIAASAASMAAVEKQVSRAQWTLDKKIQNAPVEALVFDTLYRPGEWVPAGQPVVCLLPPEQVRVRFFVSERELASLKTGEPVRVQADGTDPVRGRISFVSPTAEYSPPVIFSRENSAKLVFLVEAEFDRKIAAGLHPGQPVLVSRGPR